jgi:hypothetical protein
MEENEAPRPLDILMFRSYTVVHEPQAFPELIKQLGGCGGIGRHNKNINQLKINRIYMYNYCYTPFETEYTSVKVYTTRYAYGGSC